MSDEKIDGLDLKWWYDHASSLATQLREARRAIAGKQNVMEGLRDGLAALQKENTELKAAIGLWEAFYQRLIKVSDGLAKVLTGEKAQAARAGRRQ